MGGSIHTLKKNTEILLIRNEAIGLEVNPDKTKYMVMSRDQNAGQSHNIKTDNSSLERVEQFRLLGTTLTNQNSVQEEQTEVRECLLSFGAEYFLSSSLLSKNTKIKIWNYNFACCFVWV